MRYIRTKNHVRRRLTLHHVTTMRKAREGTKQIPCLNVWDLIDVACGSGWAGVRGIKPCAYPALLMRRRNMIASLWQVTPC
jgi:hypothetical protein